MGGNESKQEETSKRVKASPKGKKVSNSVQQNTFSCFSHTFSHSKWTIKILFLCINRELMNCMLTKCVNFYSIDIGAKKR